MSDQEITERFVGSNCGLPPEISDTYHSLDEELLGFASHFIVFEKDGFDVVWKVDAFAEP